MPSAFSCLVGGEEDRVIIGFPYYDDRSVLGCHGLKKRRRRLGEVEIYEVILALELGFPRIGQVSDALPQVKRKPVKMVGAFDDRSPMGVQSLHGHGDRLGAIVIANSTEAEG